MAVAKGTPRLSPRRDHTISSHRRGHHIINNAKHRQGGYASLVAAARYPSLVRGLMLLNSAGPLTDPADDDPARDAALLGDADGAAAAAAAVPFWRPAADAVTDAAKRVVLFFAFQRARQPERIREGERAATAAAAERGCGGCALAAGGAADTTTAPPTTHTAHNHPHTHKTSHNNNTNKHPISCVLSPSVLEMVYTNASSIDDDLVESIR